MFTPYLVLFGVIIPLVLVPEVDAGVKPLSDVVQAIISASDKADVPYKLLAGICTVESNLKPLVRNKYDGGSPSYGLCQIKEATARDMGFNGLIRDLYNPYVNALYAAKYLRYQIDRYNGDYIRAIAAYNRGSSSKHILNMGYVNRVLQVVVKL